MHTLQCCQGAFHCMLVHLLETDIVKQQSRDKLPCKTVLGMRR